MGFGEAVSTRTEIPVTADTREQRGVAASFEDAVAILKRAYENALSADPLVTVTFIVEVEQAQTHKDRPKAVDFSFRPGAIVISSESVGTCAHTGSFHGNESGSWCGDCGKQLSGDVRSEAFVPETGEVG